MKLILTYWSFDGSSLSILLLMIVVYIIINKSASRILYFALAVLLSALCLFSPLHILSAHYLFSAHMVVHVVLLLCVGPLLVLSLAPEKELLSSFFLFFKQHPVLSWLTGVGIMWFWHVPSLFNITMATAHTGSFHVLPIVETFSLIIAGILFGTPVIHPNKKFRIDTIAGVVYLFTACIGCSLLGLLITFAPIGTYHHFLAMQDSYGLNKIILQQWGITQAVDQQAAGLVMWVPCCFIYITGAMYLLVQWFKQKDLETQSLASLQVNK